MFGKLLGYAKRLSDQNLLKFGFRLLWGRLTGKSYPFLVQLNITNRCNSRCAYCWGKFFERPSPDPSLDTLKQTIDQLGAAGTFRLNLLGGEPFLREDLGEIVNHAHRYGIRCAITTNGILVPQRLEILKKLDQVCISLDGRQENNDLNRGKGMFQKAYAALEFCKSHGIPIQISSVLSKHTFDDVDFMVEVAEHFGCRVGFTTLASQLREGCTEDSGLYPTTTQTRQAVKRIYDLKCQGRPILFSKKTYKIVLAWKDFTKDIVMGDYQGKLPVECMAGKYFCIVDTSGDLYPCPQTFGKVKALNVLKDGVQKALEQAGKHGCKACSAPCTNDFNLFFNLNLQVLLENFINSR